MHIPETAAELADMLRDAAAQKQTIALAGHGSKHAMGGPTEPAAVEISTRGLKRVLQYEPRDLTISVEAGMPWTELSQLVAANGQMIPLDPPLCEQATVGGVVASNSSGPRRRLYGTARDLVIGMTFVTLEGKQVQSGGMVVKNVAGLDMAKLMIGSFGTLAAIAVVNFKLTPAPQAERSFLLAFDSLSRAVAARDGVLRSVLQPAALDLLSPAAAAPLGVNGWTLAIRVAGNLAVIERYEREFSHVSEGMGLEGGPHEELWKYVREIAPEHLAAHPNGVVVRASCTLKELEALLASMPEVAVARAGSGVAYGCFAEAAAAQEWMKRAAAAGWKAVMEYCSEAQQRALDLWPEPGGDFEVMKRIKHMFDPDGLLNRGRLYRRI